MSYTALVTFLAVEIKYLRLLSNKKKNSCHSNTEMPPTPYPSLEFKCICRPAYSN